MANPVLRVALLIFLLPAVAHSESHWESYAGWAQVYRWTCIPYYYTVCNDWFYYGYYLGYGSCTCSLFRQYQTYCYTAVDQNCYINCIQWVPVTLWRCQYGWKGANCDMPICDNPVCRSDQICARPGYCDCYRSTSTGQCQFLPCAGEEKNCYPGYCIYAESTCVCPPGFTGPNCQTITSAPDINTCSVQIFGTPNGGTKQVVAGANECAAQELNPLPVWIGKAAANSLDSIQVSWEADYNNQLPLPDRGITPYINNAPVRIGIVESNFTVTMLDQTNPISRSASCVNLDPTSTNPLPQTIQKCSPFMQWRDIGASSLIRTNLTFIVTIEAKVGGAKTGDTSQAGGRFYTPQSFTMDPSLNTTIRTVKFAFDLEPPYHCLSTASNCSIFPIFLNKSMTSNPVIEPTFNAWNDDGSGISRFHAEVYFMQPNSNGLLEEIGDPLITAEVNITLNNFRYTCLKPGVYSIILTVFDKANNSAKARKIFNYDDHDTSVMETNSPIYLSLANPATNYQYITSLDKLQNSGDSYQFTVNWTGRFDTTYKKEWLGAVKAWPIVSDGSLIDDSRGTKYGLRSIDAVPVKTGVLGYEIAYLVDGNGTGGIGVSAPNNFVAISDPTITTYQISVNSRLKDGDAIVVWLRVYDLYGRAKTVKFTTYVDTSRFNINITNSEFRKHFPEEYNSSVAINVINRVSGIKTISYEIFDNSKKVVVYSGSMTPKVLERPSAFTRKKRDTGTIPCTTTDRSCYCIPSGQCYNVTQLINIDNCWIDRAVAGSEVIINYLIYSQSGFDRDGQQKAGVLSAEDISCRDIQGLSTGAKVGIGVGVSIFLLLLILLLILLILMCVRWKYYHKHPVPYNIRTTIHNTFGRNRSPSNVHIVSDNELYGTNEKAEASKKMNTTSYSWAENLWDGKQEDISDNKVISEKDLQMGEVIAEGRFAIIRKGFLNRGNEKMPVAIKALRSGFDKTDPEVMRNKIAFMANKVKPHPNIIQFIGSLKEDNNQASPVMILELCDKPLKDWLSEISKVDSEVFEDMLSFSLQIARGIRHLHDQGIIHRRLAVRNILLKHTISGYEVKLIGFGPAKEDFDGDNANNEATLSVAVVPLKWMAPETLDTLDRKNPVYDRATDAWSYGVTLWEIFSKGEAPYANHKSPDMKAVLKRGERLNCPESCPPDLFNQVLHPCWNTNPKKRPNFSKICAIIEQFRNGSSTGYYVAPGQSGNNRNIPTGYYGADSIANNDRRPNNSAQLYHDAASG